MPQTWLVSVRYFWGRSSHSLKKSSVGRYSLYWYESFLLIPSLLIVPDSIIWDHREQIPHCISLKIRRQLSFIHFFLKAKYLLSIFYRPRAALEPQYNEKWSLHLWCSQYSGEGGKINDIGGQLNNALLPFYLPTLHPTPSYSSLKRIASVSSTCFHMTLFEAFCLLRFRLTSGCLYP